jgi:hypothetical protein
MRQMLHKSAALALLAWINFVLIFAAIAPSTSVASNLPACCRRAGVHGCSMTHTGTSRPAFQAAPCAQYPQAGTTPAQAKASGVATSASVIAAVVSHLAAQPQTEARYRVSYSRAAQKRGPPAFLA